MGAVDGINAHSIHADVAGNHLPARLAARMDRNHRDLRSDLPSNAEAFRDRSAVVGHAGICQPAGSVPVAAGGNVCVLPERSSAAARHDQSDLCGNDALHAHRDRLHGLDVHMARHGDMASELSVWKLIHGSNVQTNLIERSVTLAPANKLGLFLSGFFVE